MEQGMTERERLLTVLRGEIPDRVPWFADLGHWFRSQTGKRWDLFSINRNTEKVVELHRQVKAGWYIEAGSLHEEYYGGGVTRERQMNGDLAVERFVTPVGEVTMERKWNGKSFSWDITRHMVNTPDDLKILTYAASKRAFRPCYENWETMEALGGDTGLGFPNLGYTALGSLMSYYMGVEKSVYMIYDQPDVVQEYIDTYNRKHLELVDLYCASPAPHLFFTDNLSSDVQTPDLFKQYSYNHYRETARRFHAAGKTVSAHLDGMLRNVIGLVAEAGIDVADACTPAPNGDLTPEQIRAQAGNSIVLMGGISPGKWLPDTPEKEFVEHVREWLDLRKTSPRLVQSAGDQVPPGTELDRIKLVHDIVEEYGRY